MLDYRTLPPTESATPAPISFDEQVELGVGVADQPHEYPKTCSECEKELEYTYRVEIPSICSHCLQQHSLPNGAQARRNTNDMNVFVKQSPPGYVWDWATQSHIPKRTSPITVTVSDGYHVHGGGGSGGTNVSQGGSGAGGSGGTYTVYPGGGGGGGTYTVSSPSRPRDFYAKKTTSGYSYAPGRDDPRDWSPKQISEYLQQHYSADYLRDNYSLLRQELLYGTPGSYPFQANPDRPFISSDNDDDLFAKLTGMENSNLTGREDSAILIENDPKPEEQDMPMEQILSREEAEAAFQRASAALARLSELEQKYTPEPPNGSVIAFKLTFPQRSTSDGPRVYSYAAIRAAGLWFATGKVHPSFTVGTGLEWTQLLAGLEQFQATEFAVLRTGGEAVEIEATRTVVLSPGDVVDAFHDRAGDGENEKLDDVGDR